MKDGNKLGKRRVQRVKYKDRITCRACNKEIVNNASKELGFILNCPHCGVDLFDTEWAVQDDAIDALMSEEDKKEAAIEAGNSMMTTADFANAVKCYDLAIAISSNDAAIWNNKGRALMALRNFTGAIECYDKAIAIDSSVGYSWEAKGGALIALKKYEDAITCFNKAISINAKDEMALTGYGVALCELGRVNEGGRYLMRADSLGSTLAQKIMADYGVASSLKRKAGKARWKFW